MRLLNDSTLDSDLMYLFIPLQSPGRILELCMMGNGATPVYT